jgi:hypothetical protein
MNFNPILEALVSQLKESLFAPKDHFERVKRSATRTLVLPLIGLLGAESVFVALLGAISSLEFRMGETFFKLAGSSSDSFLVLSGVVIISLLSVVGSNLYYAQHLKRAQSEIEKLAKDAQLAASYKVLKSRFDELIAAKRQKDAYPVAALMLKRFPDYADRDPDFLQALLSDGNLDALRGLPMETPERLALPEGGRVHETPNTAAPTDRKAPLSGR